MRVVVVKRYWDFSLLEIRCEKSPKFFIFKEAYLNCVLRRYFYRLRSCYYFEYAKLMHDGYVIGAFISTPLNVFSKVLLLSMLLGSLFEPSLFYVLNNCMKRSISIYSLYPFCSS